DVYDSVCAEDITPQSSYVNVISPYWNTTGTVDIVVTASDENLTGGESGIKEVALYYRNSTDNISWSSWTLYGTNDTTYPYNWSFIAPSDGYYEFYSIATDNASNIELPPTTNDTIGGIDTTPPIANAGVDQVVDEDTEMMFSGSGSSDNIGIGNYTWTFTDQGIPVTLYGANPSYTFYTPGNYTVTLNVTNYAGNWNTDTMWVNVTDVTKQFSNVSVPGNPWKNTLPTIIDWNVTDNYNFSDFTFSDKTRLSLFIGETKLEIYLRERV
ncbi:MAG: PKD domain-containing protein, partial [Candidatus Thermoplasmatota archaeon]|nr:PKD domain-containing protein [Candidatus Thermoplasmatota archaeon]